MGEMFKIRLLRTDRGCYTYKLIQVGPIMILYWIEVWP